MNISLIGKEGCSACLMAKRYLEIKNQPYHYYNINSVEKPEGMDDIIKNCGITSLPIVIVDDKPMTFQALRELV